MLPPVDLGSIRHISRLGTTYELVRAEEVILYAAPLCLKFSESTRVEHITVNCRPSLLGKHTSAAPLAHLWPWRYCTALSTEHTPGAHVAGCSPTFRFRKCGEITMHSCAAVELLVVTRHSAVTQSALSTRVDRRVMSWNFRVMSSALVPTLYLRYSRIYHLFMELQRFSRFKSL